MTRWLVKTEPEECSIDDFARSPDIAIVWEGVRNYQARNFIRDMTLGDEVFVYHSSCKHIGIAGLAKISRTGLVDNAQFNPESRYFDPKSTPNKPRWWMVELEHIETFAEILPLASIKQMPDITELGLVKKGSRLSIMPVNAGEFDVLLAHAKRS